jgi:DAK2 domain fusion protein YloV
MAAENKSTRAVKGKAITTISGDELRLLTEAGLIWLKTNQQVVNALNVFPVPDGDTGTNMVLTMQSAYDEIADFPGKSAGKMAYAIANGALMGARGNSGVILSQIWRGFARSLDGAERIDKNNIINAFSAARETAYKGVVRPVEGTILTVIKDVAQEMQDSATQVDNLQQLLEIAVSAADRSVQKTPDLLPVLKEAGVVDSGGKGLFFILEGMLRYLHGLPLDTSTTTIQPLAAMNLEDTLESIEPGQDFEIVLDFKPQIDLNIEHFYASLEEMGTSIQIGEGDGMYRVHIHVPDDKLYEPISYVKSLGTVTKVAIENLVAQMEEIELQRGTRLKLAPIEPGQIAVVAVAPGPGIARVFASLGVAAIVEGGQTMNPSTQELLRSFENLPTDKVIILPNNKNVILSAQSAAELTVKHVQVIPTTTIPQGLSAMLRLAPEGKYEQVVRDMNAAIGEVETGEITIATRSVEIDGVQVQEGQLIILHNGKLVAADEDLTSACVRFLDDAGAADYELVTLFYGKDVSKSQVAVITDSLRQKYPDLEFELQEGGQPHYYFIIGLE